MKLVTLEAFKKLRPRAQGYVSYMEAELPGSELKKHQANPYQKDTKDYEEFAAGQQLGVLIAQDSEE